MIRPLVIAIVSAIYLIASIEAQQPGTYNNVLSYFKEHPLIDKNGAPTETFQNVLKKVSTMSSPPAGARPAAIPPVSPYRPNGYSPNYAQYQAYAQAQYRQAQAQAQARTAVMFPPVPGTTPPQAPPPAAAPSPSQPAPEPAPAPAPAEKHEESAPAEKHEEPAPQPESSPEPQAAPEEPKQEPAASEPQASPEVAQPTEPAPEPQGASQEEPAWTAQGAAEHQPAEAVEQVQPTTEESANPQGEEQQPDEASVTPAGESDGSGTLEITTEANDLGIPPASGSMNNMTDDIASNNSSMLNSTSNGMVGSSVGIGGSTYTYSSIDMMIPSAQSPPPSAPTTYVPPMASAATLNTRFDYLLCLTLLFSAMAFVL